MESTQQTSTEAISLPYIWRVGGRSIFINSNGVYRDRMNARPSNGTSNRTSTQNAVTKYGVRSHIRPVQALSLQAVHSTRVEFVRNAGTLAYMAPEQTGARIARLIPESISTRCVSPYTRWSQANSHLLPAMLWNGSLNAISHGGGTLTM
jgi:hypothetical protein